MSTRAITGVMSWAVLAVLLCLILAPALGLAQESAATESILPSPPEITYFEATASFLCPVHLPRDYDPERAYPLIVGLHGYASSPQRFHSLYYAFAHPDFIYAAPQAPYALPMGTELGYGWLPDIQSDDLYEHFSQVTQEYVLTLIDQLKARYNVSEVYLLGFSQGCALSYLVGINNPELVSGLICYGGWLETGWFTDEQFAAARDIPVFIGYGRDDQIMGYDKAAAAMDELTRRGFTVELYGYDEGHSITADALQAAQRWMFGDPEPPGQPNAEAGV
ncbi:dienelactone hydrolase family protein [bacterium]|nr:dienelactone hydrolase family protein [bacterium]